MVGKVRVISITLTDTQYNSSYINIHKTTFLFFFAERVHVYLTLIILKHLAT